MPAFILKDQHGKGFDSSAFVGKQKLVVYFYPKDDTPGCTKEACAFRDGFSEFKKRGAVVLGVSPDSVKSHDKFVEKFKLPFTLLADEDKKIANDYGVWGEKSFMGRKYMGVHRVTFLIAPDGKIQESSVGFSKKDLEKMAAAAARATSTPPTSFFKPGEVIPDSKPG